MPILDSQKTDILWKKIAFGTTETDIIGKAGNNETIASPIVITANSVWKDSVPSTPPGSSTSIVEVYSTTSAVECKEDLTVSGSKTWVAVLDVLDPIEPSNILQNWIPASFSSQYAVKVYAGDPNVAGVIQNPLATGFEWIFDYSAGVLHFPNSVPSAIISNGAWLVGYRYIGDIGVGSAETTDDLFRIIDNSDNTKKLAFEVSPITTATTRTYTALDTNGFLSLTDALLASNRIPYASGSAGILTSNANFTFDGTTLKANAITIGDGAASNKILTFDATNDGTITWINSTSTFQFDNKVEISEQTTLHYGQPTAQGGSGLKVIFNDDDAGAHLHFLSYNTGSGIAARIEAQASLLQLSALAVESEVRFDARQGLRIYNGSAAIFDSAAGNDIQIKPYGTYEGQTTPLRFFELTANGINYFGIKAADSIPTSYTLVLPTNTPVAGDALKVLSIAGDIINSEWGAAGGGTSTFLDDVFRIQDNVDNSKQLAFEVSDITTGTTRTVTALNVDGYMVLSNAALSTQNLIPYVGASGLINTSSLFSWDPTSETLTTTEIDVDEVTVSRAADFSFITGTRVPYGPGLSTTANFNFTSNILYSPSIITGVGGIDHIEIGSAIQLKSVGGIQSFIRFRENDANGVSYVELIGPATLAQNFQIILPSNAPSAGQFLSAATWSDPVITTEWATPSGSGTVNSGLTGKLAFYPSDGTTVDDAAGLHYDSATARLGINVSSGWTGKLNIAPDSTTEDGIHLQGISSMASTARFLKILDSASNEILAIENDGGIRIRTTGTNYFKVKGQSAGSLDFSYNGSATFQMWFDGRFNAGASSLRFAAASSSVGSARIIWYGGSSSVDITTGYIYRVATQPVTPVYLHGFDWAGRLEYLTKADTVTAEQRYLNYNWTTNALTVSTGFTTQRFAYFSAPNMSINTSQTVTNAATVYIEGAPTNGGAGTLTNPYALWVDTGTSRFDGNITFSGVTGEANLILTDDLADALTIKEGSNPYFRFVSTNSAERIESHKTLKLIEIAALGTGANGDLWSDSTNKALKTFQSGISQFLAGNLVQVSSNVTVSNTVTETALMSVTLPANFWTVGKTIIFKATGLLSTHASGDVSFEPKIKYGSTVVNGSGFGVYASNSLTNRFWTYEFILTCRSTGSSGTVIGQGWINWTNSSGSAFDTYVSTSTVTINTTTSNNLELTWTWGAAQTGNSVTITNGCMIIV